MWVCYQLGIPLLIAHFICLMKHSYLSLTQYGHACQHQAKNTGENLAVTKGCQSSEALVYFILNNFVSKLFKALIQVVI